MISGAFSKIGNTSHYLRILYQKARSSATPEKKFRLFWLLWVWG
ncbi:hypothetical protein [Dactylococcopsis salina]|nr:hypothetical protein [Dactylococcopsis salina]